MTGPWGNQEVDRLFASQLLIFFLRVCGEGVNIVSLEICQCIFVGQLPILFLW